MAFKPFIYPEFKDWVKRLAQEGTRVACAVKFSDGTFGTCGPIDLGFQIFSQKCKNFRRLSSDWIPDVKDLKKITKPLGDISKNQNVLKLYASHALKFFIGKDTKFGTGENFLWEKIVLFKDLKYSSNAINGWHSPVISLSDIIDWENFNISSFSQKPKGSRWSCLGENVPPHYRHRISGFEYRSGQSPIQKPYCCK